MTTTKPANATELAELIDSFMVSSTSDPATGYQLTADAMWKAALAAFNYAADKGGVTGFQASWAALKFYGEAMHVKGPFMITKVEDALYPQYDLVGRLEEFITEQREFLREKAQELMDKDSGHASKTVVEHWKKLAGDDANV